MVTLACLIYLVDLASLVSLFQQPDKPTDQFSRSSVLYSLAKSSARPGV
jgi:hypothetical protein